MTEAEIRGQKSSWTECAPRVAVNFATLASQQLEPGNGLVIRARPCQGGRLWTSAADARHRRPLTGSSVSQGPGLWPGAG
jgi:hypothetical protein